MPERIFDALGINAKDNTFFKGVVVGDIDKPIRTWAFQIDLSIHPYVVERIPLLKDLWILIEDMPRDGQNKDRQTS